MSFIIAITLLTFVLTNLIFITNADNSEDHRVFTEIFLPTYWVGIICVYISGPHLAAIVINGFFGCIIIAGVINSTLKRR